MNRLRPYAKFVVALAGCAAVVLADGHVTPAEICVAVVTLGGIYGIKNSPQEPEGE